MTIRTRRGAPRRLARSACAAVAGTLALAPAASAASWGYEQLTPGDGGAYDPYAIAVSADTSTAFVAMVGTPLGGQPSDGRSGPYLYGLRSGAPPWTLGPVDVDNGSQLFKVLRKVSADGSSALTVSTDPLNGDARGGLYRFDAGGGAVNLTQPLTFGQSTEMAATPDTSLTAFRTTGVGAGVYLGAPGAAPELVSVDNAGTAVAAPKLGGATGSTTRSLAEGALSAAGDSVIFATTTAVAGAGDNDGVAEDLYVRDLAAGVTTVVSDATPGVAADSVASGAEFRWASADHGLVMWRTREALLPSDTDDAIDLYGRDLGTGTIAHLTQGALVDGNPSGNASGPTNDIEVAAVSADGTRIYFVSRERLTQDAPAAGSLFSLYERDTASATTRLVAPALLAADSASNTAGSLTNHSANELSLRNIRIRPDGVVMRLATPLAGDADALTDIYSWTPDDGLRLLSVPEPGAPPSADADATLVAINPGSFIEFGPIAGGRGVTADGSRVFLTTAQALVAEDTDGGFRDVYVVGPDGIELVTPPGDAPQHGFYVDSSADGSRVIVQTRETVLASDLDNAGLDTYVAILGGGSPPSTPPPVTDPPGPSGPPGPPPQVPQPAPPASSAPKPPEAPPVPNDPGPPDGDDSGSAAELSADVERTLQGRRGLAVTVDASVAGRLRLWARAELARGADPVTVGADRVRVQAGSERLELRLTKAAARRLTERGRLRIRLELRLVPATEARAVTERVTVVVRPGQRR